jgi:2-hydroxy-3-keto-5-methylthiopentenyl-1-phosphate phosphatase
MCAWYSKNSVTKKKFALACDHMGVDLMVKEQMKKLSRNKVVFCDFDGTITIEDIVDDLFSRYADDSWKEIEKLWEWGKIGSEKCLQLQLACIKHITEDDLLRFASDVAIDPYFSEFVKSMKNDGIDLYIVSDGFDRLIEPILTNHCISNIPVFSNGLKIEGNKLIPSFSLKTNECYSGSGMCKCAIIDKYRANRAVIYIGDGRSDICAIRNADIVFAKGKLSNYCIENCINFFQFSHFGDVINILFKKERKGVIR